MSILSAETFAMVARVFPRKDQAFGHQSNCLELVDFLDNLGMLFGSTTRVTRVSLTDMRNINNPALQAERFVFVSDKSYLFYQGQESRHFGIRAS